MDKNLIINSLKQKGFKLTKARLKLIKIFEVNHSISVPEIIRLLNTEGLSINKSTVYREINFLLKQNIIKQIDFRERGTKYELEDKKHHHHLICLGCKTTQDFELNQDLISQEKIIKKTKNFQVLNHSLEFFGLCSNCQKSNQKIYS